MTSAIDIIKYTIPIAIDEFCDDLLNCPFCGAKAELYQLTNHNPIDHELEVQWFADCSECDANVSYELTRQEAIDSWNRRI